MTKESRHGRERHIVQHGLADQIVTQVMEAHILDDCLSADDVPKWKIAIERSLRSWVDGTSNVLSAVTWRSMMARA